MTFGYHKGYLNGYAAAQATWEGLKISLQEQLVEARFLAQSQAARADAAVDHLMTKIGLSEISTVAKQERAARANAVRDAVVRAPQDPWTDLPIGHPEGSYKNALEAEMTLDGADGN